MMAATKIKNDFSYYRPKTLDEALALIDRYQAGGVLMAGGSEIIPAMKALVLMPDQIISLKGISGLDFLEYKRGEGLRIGPVTTLARLESDAAVRGVYPSLYQGIHSMSNTNILNSSTITGNICYAVPSADTAPPLLTLDAYLKVRSVDSERIVPVRELFTGVRRTCLAKNEIVVEIAIPEPDPDAVMVYFKNTVRRALDLAIAGVATYVVMEGDICKDIRIALGAVAAVPGRAPEAEAMLRGRRLTRGLVEEAALHVSQRECAPISDIRASKEYRRELVRLSVRDGLTLALEKKDKKGGQR